MEDTFLKASALSTYAAIALILGAATILFLRPLLAVQTDKGEPPLLHTSIPFFGHIIRLLRQGSDYFLDLERRYHKPLYVLLLGKSRLYVVASPEWAVAVNRSYKSLQFNTLAAQALENLFCMDKASMDIINHNLNGEDGTRSGVMLEIHDMLFSTLAPGQHLDELNDNILAAILPDINRLARDDPQQVEFWSWLRHHFSLASTSALWGPKNPFALYPDIEPAFWEFEAHMLSLMMTPLPQYFARKPWQARQRLFDTFAQYMANKTYDEPGTSQLIRNRVDINMTKFGMSPKMHGYGDVSLLFGALLNTIPSAFWLISYIIEDPHLLSEIRAEIDKCISSSSSKEGEKRTINVVALRSACPLLNSCFREVLRITGSVNINRHVAEDVTVTNSSTGETYTLKKGGTILFASNVIHQRDLWGTDAAAFNPRRFLQSRETTTGTRPPDPAAPFRDPQGKVYSGAFRSFGGGNNICPGRFFAQTEVLGLISLFVAGFEIEGVNTPGEYKTPPFEDFKLSLGVLKPKEDVDVRVSRRKGYESVEWAFEM